MAPMQDEVEMIKETAKAVRQIHLLPTIADLVATRWRFLPAGDSSSYGCCDKQLKSLR
jgi:hypothetical protein